MTVKFEDLREGSVVIVRGAFGKDPEERVKVEGLEKDIKDGYPGIYYNRSWAYLDQVVRVVQY